jgi:hypothetical protein
MHIHHLIMSLRYSLTHGSLRSKTLGYSFPTHLIYQFFDRYVVIFKDFFLNCHSLKQIFEDVENVTRGNSSRHLQFFHAPKNHTHSGENPPVFRLFPVPAAGPGPVAGYQPTDPFLPAFLL